MAKYMVLFEIDNQMLPKNPQEKKALMTSLIASVNQQVKSGLIKDYGDFGGMKGYVVVECSPEEVFTLTAGYMPFAKFTVHAVTSLKEVNKAIKAMKG